jgi:hypothetical protein
MTAKKSSNSIAPNATETFRGLVVCLRDDYAADLLAD